ncbi:MAG TPA: cobyric acid synthase [Thermoleophilaceae bacterium]|nr:cobyric acid synthase [Thermoleophilaceae bacterium]
MSALIVQGTSSWAGKSLVTTALCRHFARLGVRVAPFKAQNMSNNARVVAGGEIGAAQYLQALAARVEPEVRMNPVLVKPEGDVRSQVVVGGVVDRELGAIPWRERTGRLWPVVEDSLRSLLHDYDLVLLEGAGSPAEINLADCDMTNLRAARLADATALLVCDVDRGGAFAHLYGTWALLDTPDRTRIGAFVLNKFRGDPELLAPAPERLTDLTGVPFAGVVPWLEHGLPDEDGVATSGVAPPGAPLVAVVRYPTASNLDELKPLEQVAKLRFARRPSEIDGAELVVLPGSKHVGADLEWLRAQGLDAAIAARAEAGGRVLGICGGLQMLGEELRGGETGLDSDSQGEVAFSDVMRPKSRPHPAIREAGGGGVAGLGLLALRTSFGREKLVQRTEAQFADGLTGAWSALAGRGLSGYEIRNGRTVATVAVEEALSGGRGWVSGAVLGVSVHGLFEEPTLVAALLGRAPRRSLDIAIDELTDGVVAALDMASIERLAGVAA